MTSRKMDPFAAVPIRPSAIQLKNTMSLLTFCGNSSPPFEATSTNPVESLYLHVILQGGLQSARHWDGPKLSPSLMDINNVPFILFGRGTNITSAGPSKISEKSRRKSIL